MYDITSMFCEGGHVKHMELQPVKPWAWLLNSRKYYYYYYIISIIIFIIIIIIIIIFNSFGSGANSLPRDKSAEI